LHKTGRSERLERLRGQVPPGILEPRPVPGMLRKPVGPLPPGRRAAGGGERLRAQPPRGILELSLVPGMTRKRIAALHQAIGVRGLDDLKAAAEAGRVRTVKGFGPKTEAKILEGIRGLATREER